jgi:hypothetical protein
VPQLPAPWSTQIPFGSSVPVATFVQTPLEVPRLHDLHEALQVVAQQTPCAHTLDAHSVPVEQGAPLSFLPHELPLQTLGATQFAVDVQALKHFVAPLQANGAQGREAGATHWPVALQVEAPV